MGVRDPARPSSFISPNANGSHLQTRLSARNRPESRRNDQPSVFLVPVEVNAIKTPAMTTTMPATISAVGIHESEEGTKQNSFGEPSRFRIPFCTRHSLGGVQKFPTTMRTAPTMTP